MTTIIPQIIFQTSRDRPPNYLVNMIKQKCPNWTYIHFNDNDIIKFFIKNPLDEFPDIINKFNSIKNGAHKADLFRYYFIYIKGGVFLDSDAMFQTNIDNICLNYDFFSVNSTYCPGCIFQGLIGATPKNKIIYDALKDAYNINVNLLANNYLLICSNLYHILKTYTNDNVKYNIKLYEEIYGSDEIAITVDPNRKNLIIITHYFILKTVPNSFFNYSHITYHKILNKSKNNRRPVVKRFYKL